MFSEKLTELSSVVTGLASNVTEANQNLIGKEQELDAAAEQLKSNVHGFVNDAIGRFAATHVEPDHVIYATQNMDAFAAVEAALNDGHQYVRLHVAANMVVQWPGHLAIPPGKGVYITGDSRSTAVVEFTRSERYGTDEPARHLITGITTGIGCYFATVSVLLKHVPTLDTLPAPFQHGLVRIDPIAYGAAPISMFFNDTTFAVYDCVLYFEGMSTTTVNAIFRACEITRQKHNWFDGNSNIGWVGIGGWSTLSASVDLRKHNNVQPVDDGTGAVFDFINVWASGDDATATMLANNAAKANFYNGVLR